MSANGSERSMPATPASSVTPSESREAPPTVPRESSKMISKEKFSCAVESERFLKFSEERQPKPTRSRFDNMAGWRTQSHFQGTAVHPQTPLGPPPSSAPVPPGMYGDRVHRPSMARGVPTYVTRNNWAAAGEGQFQRNSRLYIPGQGYAHGEY